MPGKILDLHIVLFLEQNGSQRGVLCDRYYALRCLYRLLAFISIWFIFVFFPEPPALILFFRTSRLEFWPMHGDSPFEVFRGLEFTVASEAAEDQPHDDPNSHH